MKNRFLLGTALAFLAVPPFAFADGKFYTEDPIAPDVPYQRALILIENGTETLILQSQYLVETATNAPPTVGWVVPVPAVPEIASVTGHVIEPFLIKLGVAAAPRVIRPGVPLAAFYLSVVGFVASVLVYAVARSAHRKAKALRFTKWFGYASFLSLGVLILNPSYLGIDGVDVIQSEKAGIYDVEVVRSESPEGLIEWLDANGFRFVASDAPVIDQYLQKDWRFVVAKIRPEEVESRDRAPGRLVDPLILRFPISTPVYPLALTSTVGTEVQLLLFTLSDTKVNCGDRLPIRYADNEWRARGWEEFKDDLKGTFEFEKTDFAWLCKFNGTLSPDQQREDLIFETDLDQSPYRETVWQWW